MISVSVISILGSFQRWLGCPPCLPLVRPRHIFRLHRGGVFGLSKNCGVKRVEIRQGTVWLTTACANGDVLLQPGDRLDLTGPWPVVLESLADAEIQLSA